MNWFQTAGVIAVLSALLGLFWAPSTETSPLQGDPARGRKVFVKKKCVECHAVLGSGGSVGPDLAEVGKRRSFHALVAQLWDHSPKMLESMTEKQIRWPRIMNEEMADLISYLYYLTYFGEPGDFQEGKKAFEDKSCVRCHSIGGQGGDVGPDLDEYGSTASALKIVTSMWNHGPNMIGKQRRLEIESPTFSGSEVADILAFLRGSTTELSRNTEYQNPGHPDRGREVFEEKQCATCHPVRGMGGGAGDGPDLADAELRRTVSELAGTLWNHGPLIWKELGNMGIAIPPFTVEEMTDLVSYLYFIEYYDETGDPKAGSRLYEERGCEQCHSGDVEGIEAPELSKMVSTRNPVALAAAFWNHTPDMLEAQTELMLPWPRFTEQELRDLTCFLRQR